MWGLLRLILVFWPSGLWTLVCIVSQFVTVVTSDLICDPLLLLLPLFLVSDLGRVDSGGGSGRISRFSGVPLVLILLLLFIFPSLIGRLGLRGGSGSLRSLGVLSVGHRSLVLNFVRGGVSGSTSSEDL